MTETDTVVAGDLLAEPHVAGRRVPVRTLYERVEADGDAPAAVARRFDLDPATVYRALAYAHTHPEELAAARSERETAHEAFRERCAEAAADATARSGQRASSGED